MSSTEKAEARGQRFPPTTPEKLITDSDGQLTIKRLDEGDYKLVEVVAPDGYKPTAGDILFTIDKEHGIYEEYKLWVPNDPETIDVPLKKVDGPGGNPLQNAAFMLYRVVKDQDGKVVESFEVDSYFSDGSGSIILKGLGVGTYRLVELKAPPGHEIHPDYAYVDVQIVLENNTLKVKSIVNAGGQDITGSGEIINDLQINPQDPTFDILVKKVDSDDENLSLEGAEFALDKQNDSGEGWTELRRERTGELGYILFDKLEAGWYRVRETSPPPGYTLGPKYESEPLWVGDFTPLPGKFSIGYSSGDEQPLTIVPQLPLGLSISERQAYALEDLVNAVEVFANKANTADLTITKRDANSNDILVGAEFALYYSASGPDADKHFEDWHLIRDGLKTDSNGQIVIKDVTKKSGRYYLQETKAPPGYDVKDPKLHDHDAESSLIAPGLYALDIDMNSDERSHYTFNVFNYPSNDIKGSVTLRKVNGEDPDHSLEGAVFALYKQRRDNREWELIASNLRTGADGTITYRDLIAGVYKLVEIEPPPGFVIDNDYEAYSAIFTLTEDMLESGEALDLVHPGTIKVANYSESAYTDVIVVKMDADNTEKRLPGAEFKLYKVLGYNEEGEAYYQLYRSDLVTDSKGTLTISNLKAGEYALQEVKAPAGYILSSRYIHFTIEEESPGKVMAIDPIRVYNRLESNPDDGSSSPGGGSSGGGGSGGGTTRPDTDNWVTEVSTTTPIEPSLDPGIGLNLNDPNLNNPLTGRFPAKTCGSALMMIVAGAFLYRRKPD